MPIGRPPSPSHPRRSRPARRRARAALPGRPALPRRPARSSRPARVAVATLGLALLSPSAATAGAAWQAPVPGGVARPFAVGPDRFAAGQHRGVDLTAPVGTRVRAACGGRVTFVGRVAGNGRTVSVRCGSLVATYLHLQSVAVRRGARVVPGAPIGAAGRSGRPSPGPPHLHLGAREAATGRYVDPLALIAGATPPAPPVPPAGRAPRPAPPPLGPAPRPATSAPVAPRSWPLRSPAPAVAPAPTARSRPVPVPLAAWLGVALMAAGLPLGALVRRGRHRAAAAVRARAGAAQGAR